MIFCFALLAFFAMHHPLHSNDSYSIDHAMVSIYAVNSENGTVLIDENSDLSLNPGSCMKIFTTGAALHLLGVDSRFETHLDYDGFIDKSNVLHGNIYIRGGGDPCLGSDRIPKNEEKQIELWADAIQNLGIKKINGSIVPDASKWEKALAVPSWSWEDLGNYYGAGACALSFHENLYTLVFKPGSNIGEKANILRTDPQMPSIVFHNEVTTGPEGSGDRACIYGCEFFPVQYVRGTIPAGVNEFSIRGAIPNPPAYCAARLTQELERRGIVIKEEEKEPNSRTTIFHTTYSPTVGEIVYWTNQKSINLYAEHLLKKMGDGSTASGLKAVTEFWHSQNIDLNGFNMADGSGLSRKNLATTKQCVEVLLKMKNAYFFPIFFESLPIKDNLMRAKSGSMSLVRAYVGYIDKIAFAIIINQCANNQIMNDRVKILFSKLNELKA